MKVSVTAVLLSLSVFSVGAIPTNAAEDKQGDLHQGSVIGSAPSELPHVIGHLDKRRMRNSRNGGIRNDPDNRPPPADPIHRKRAPADMEWYPDGVHDDADLVKRSFDSIVAGNVISKRGEETETTDALFPTESSEFVYNEKRTSEEEPESEIPDSLFSTETSDFIYNEKRTAVEEPEFNSELIVKGRGKTSPPIIDSDGKPRHEADGSPRFLGPRYKDIPPPSKVHKRSTFDVDANDHAKYTGYNAPREKGHPPASKRGYPPTHRTPGVGKGVKKVKKPPVKDSKNELHARHSDEIPTKHEKLPPGKKRMPKKPPGNGASMHADQGEASGTFKFGPPGGRERQPKIFPMSGKEASYHN